MTDKKTCVLSIAGSDSSAGAGIQADSKAISATGAYAATAITMITAQNTLGVTEIFTLPITIINAQIDAIFSDLSVKAVKIGMLYNRETMKAVQQRLEHWRANNIVLDPVMVAQSGAPLIDAAAIQTLKTLFPMAALITPNIPEANALLQENITDIDAMCVAAQQLGKEYQTNVLLKGGHLTVTPCTDIFFNQQNNTIVHFAKPRIITQNIHGTGCTLSSAIASFLAQGNTLETAIRRAKHYLNHAIQAAIDWQLGSGPGPVDHFSNLRNIHDDF